MKIAIIVPSPARRWHGILVERLAAAGHTLAIIAQSQPDWPLATRAMLALERRLIHRGDLSRSVQIAAVGDGGSADLTVDLGAAANRPAGSLRIAFDGGFDDASVPAALAAGRLPQVDVLLDGRSIARAAPMVDNRIFTVAATDDVFARAISLTLSAIARHAGGELAAEPFFARAQNNPFLPHYLGGVLPRIAREALRRRRFHYAHWRVGYRRRDGQGVAETGRLGDGWTVLPDDGSHFYADPFPFEHDGRRYIFVEDYPHATGKAVISVAEIDGNGVANRPAPVLEEPHHLSYPQVFEHGEEIWMLPEGSGSGKLTLYRAELFPHRWVPAATLLEGEISDATLLIRDDGFWLLATDREGGLGSTSDTLVVFSAPALTGPWTPHPRNPVLIDRRRARPGGAVIRRDGKIYIPIQDGTEGYGAGLGLSEIVRLDHSDVILGSPRPISGKGDFSYPQIHTLNRSGTLEVIDGIAAVRKAHALSRAS